jgi:hypothetical protein
MPRAIPLRSDFTAMQLRSLARRAKGAAQARRLLALAVIYDGGSRSEAARLGNVTLQCPYRSRRRRSWSSSSAR